MTISNEPDNKPLIFQHVIYELLRHNDLKRTAKKGFNEKIARILCVFSAFYIHFNMLKSDPNQTYDFFIDNFNIQASKWVGLIENMTPIVFSRSNFNSLSEEDYF